MSNLFLLQALPKSSRPSQHTSCCNAKGPNQLASLLLVRCQIVYNFKCIANPAVHPSTPPAAMRKGRTSLHHYCLFDVKLFTISSASQLQPSIPAHLLLQCERA